MNRYLCSTTSLKFHTVQKCSIIGSCDKVQAYVFTISSSLLQKKREKEFCNTYIKVVLYLNNYWIQSVQQELLCISHRGHCMYLMHFLLRFEYVEHNSLIRCFVAAFINHFQSNCFFFQMFFERNFTVVLRLKLQLAHNIDKCCSKTLLKLSKCLLRMLL